MNLQAEIGTLRARLMTLKTRSGSFLRVYSWIARDFVSFAGLRMLMLLAMSGISVGIRVGVVAGVLGAIKNFAASGSGTVGDGLVDIPFLGAIDYTLFGALIFLTLVSNAVVSFLYERIVFRAAYEYQPDIIGRSLEIYSGCPNIYHALDLPPSEQRNFISAVLRHARMITVFTRIILFATFGFIASIACYAILIVIKPLITIVFTLIIALFLPFFYYLSLKGVRTREFTPIAFRNLGSFAQELDRDLQAQTPPSKTDQHDRIEALISSTQAQDAFEAFLQQRFVVFKAQFASGLLMAAILAISVTIFLSSLGQDSALGGDFVLFFALLFVMGTSLSGSLKAVVAGNRFFRSLKFFYTVLGPGGQKPLFETRQRGVALAYERAGGDVLPLAENHAVFVYIAGAGRRFDFQPFVDRLLPVCALPKNGDAAMALSKLKQGPGTAEFQGDYELVFNTGTCDDSENSRGNAATVHQSQISGPRFFVLKEPLDRIPETKGHWVYVWGTREKMVGDLTDGDKGRLPSGRNLSKRLSGSGRAARNGGSIDLDDLEA